MPLKALLLCILFFSIQNYATKVPVKRVYLYAPLWGDIFEQEITPVGSVSMSRDGCRNHLYLLKKALQQKNITLVQIKFVALQKLVLKPSERLLVFDITGKKQQLKTLLKRYNPAQCMLVLWEPPTIAPDGYDRSLHHSFKIIFTFWDDLVDNKKYYKLFYPHSLTRMEQSKAFNKKKLCAMIFGKKNWISNQPFINLYKMREEIVQFFEHNAPDSFDLYGTHWDTALHVYKGTTPNKQECLKHYKFCFAYENTGNMAGYITEKIFDAMIAGTVPIYYGAQNITKYIPKHCFIDARDFIDHASLFKYLHTMTEQEYLCYQQAIVDFLQSPQAQLFSYDQFVTTMIKAVAYD